VNAAALPRSLEAPLAEAARRGCAHAQGRVERIRSQVLVVRDGELQTAADTTISGTGLRVVHRGSQGFAATVAPNPGPALAATAIEVATACGAAARQPVELAPEPVHGHVEWESPYQVDPVGLPLAEKVGLLTRWSRQLLASPVVDHVTAGVMVVEEDRRYADLTGTTARQRRVRVHPWVEAITVAPDGEFETLRTLAPPTGRGWEYLTGEGWDFEAELAELPGLLADKARAPSVEPGRYDLVIDPTNLWLTIHESVGHATELDRALGYEAAYAGTSFATPDGLGHLRYGSPLMDVTGDRTTPHGLATVAIDDEGVAAQRFDLVRQGILVGYQLDRATAHIGGAGRSNGCAFADSPLHVPIQRMANVSLASAPTHGPSTHALISGVERGIFIEGDRSWSIDMQRRNFQFTGQRFHRIQSGRLVGQVRDVAYQASTTEFWGALEALGGSSTYRLGGAFNCGKGQPGQVAPVSHGCPSVVVGGVRVLNTRQEAGR